MLIQTTFNTNFSTEEHPLALSIRFFQGLGYSLETQETRHLKFRSKLPWVYSFSPIKQHHIITINYQEEAVRIAINGFPSKDKQKALKTFAIPLYSNINSRLLREKCLVKKCSQKAGKSLFINT
ncbi:hypothetical protein [Algivirga pacifica]|uniref:hypothetical protein n=1 Tax=Algivirga pacifica TaxID=1162670 RepID=UPI0031E65BC8